MIDVLLLNPKEKGGFFERMPPLGLAYIAANLERHDHSVKIIDFEVESRGIGHWLEKYQPQFVGISGTSHTRFESFDLAREAKAFNKDIVTLYGGVHATFTAFDTLKNIREIDYIVRGEGEYTIVDLLNTLKKSNDLQKVRGVTYRSDWGIVDNPPAQRIKPLDSLPNPAYHLLNMAQYAINMEFIKQRGISTITSRGCRARCSFCSASRMFDYQVTTHSIVRVLDEIEFLFKSYGFKGVKIFDSTFSMKRDHVNAFCDAIMQRDLCFPWECEIRVGTVDQEMLEKMRQAGCYYVDFGIESASQRVLNQMRKGFTVEQAEELLELCTCVGVRTKVFFSFGHIGETMDDAKKTFQFIERHKDKIATVAMGAGVRIYPGTYLEDYARKNGLLPVHFEWSTPYDDEHLRAILQTRCVPILIQRQLGYQELEEIALKIYSQRFGGWKGFKRGMGKVTDAEKIMKLIPLMKLRLKRMLKRRG